MPLPHPLPQPSFRHMSRPPLPYSKDTSSPSPPPSYTSQMSPRVAGRRSGGDIFSVDERPAQPRRASAFAGAADRRRSSRFVDEQASSSSSSRHLQFFMRKSTSLKAEPASRRELDVMHRNCFVDEIEGSEDVSDEEATISSGGGLSGTSTYFVFSFLSNSVSLLLSSLTSNLVSYLVLSRLISSLSLFLTFSVFLLGFFRLRGLPATRASPA